MTEKLESNDEEIIDRYTVITIWDNGEETIDRYAVVNNHQELEDSVDYPASWQHYFLGLSLNHNAASLQINCDGLEIKGVKTFEW